MIFKIDFEKAFDSLSWDYLDKILEKFGFGDKWRGWVKACQFSSRAAMLANGSPTEEFSLNRGLRQGDPLSHFLFILAIEGLHDLISMAVREDNVVLVADWTADAIPNMSKVLKEFQDMSGLKINIHKSTIYGVGVEPEVIYQIADQAGCGKGDLPFSYLGIPVGSNMSNIAKWNVLVCKFENRLSKWKANCLSAGGRLTLVRLVLGSLPTYLLSMFQGPKGIIKKLETLRSNFFGGGKMGDNKINWIKWEKVIASKDFGGFGIFSLFAFNVALLQKWWWRFVVDVSHGWVRLIKSIHGIHGGFDRVGKRSQYVGTWSKLVDSSLKLHENNILPLNTLERKLFVWSACMYKIELEVDLTTSRGSGVSKGAAPLWRGLGAAPLAGSKGQNPWLGSQNLTEFCMWEHNGKLNFLRVIMGKNISSESDITIQVGIQITTTNPKFPYKDLGIEKQLNFGRRCGLVLNLFVIDLIDSSTWTLIKIVGFMINGLVIIGIGLGGEMLGEVVRRVNYRRCLIYWKVLRFQIEFTGFGGLWIWMGFFQLSLLGISLITSTFTMGWRLLDGVKFSQLESTSFCGVLRQIDYLLDSLFQNVGWICPLSFVLCVIWCNISFPDFASIKEWLSWVDDQRGRRRHRLEVIVITTLWMLWRFRNSVTFDGDKIKKSSLFDNVVLLSFSWLKNRDSNSDGINEIIPYY
uniref:Reverse transcriptase domain-containing protein n=1 Tax=Lactuca sativa TaxID=4236 RepID=A0A9R1VMQ4_LACSA|nr:hypothetical protein LSAT_V11C500236740 [Lactuca sativa]